MACWRSSDVIANGIRIHYYRTGGDKPPLVLAHGITDNGLCWTPVALALESDHDVIMPDARGHGLSEVPRDGYTWEHLAEDLAAFIEALRLEHPALLGHSMGAETVAAVSADHPERVGCALLCDPPWRDEATAAQRTEHAAEFERGILERRGKTRAELIALCRAENAAWPEGELGPWADAKRQVSPLVAQIVASPWRNWRDTVRRIQCPTLLITGDPEKGAIVPPEGAREAAELMADARVVRLDAGHSIRREAFDDYIRAVRDFLGATIHA